MSYEQMQSTMQFILEQQAQNAALMQKYEARVGRLEDAFVTLTELARNTDQRMDSGDERIVLLEEHLKTQVDSLHAFLQAQSEDFYARMAADKADYEARRVVDKKDFYTRLAAQHEEFDERTQVLTEQTAKTDQRLDRLSNLVERYLERKNGKT